MAFDSGGTSWDTFDLSMDVQFEHPGRGFEPNDKLAHGGSATVSGQLVDRNAPNCEGSGATTITQTDGEQFSLNFHRVK